MSASYGQLAQPPNLMSLYLQMDQRNRSENMMMHGLGLLASHWASPESAHDIMASVGGGADAGQQVSNLMSLYNAQQGMQGQQAMLGQADAIDKKLNLPPGTARAEILAGRGPDLVRNEMPTDQQRNITADHDMFIKGGGSEEDWQKYYLPTIITGGLPGMTGDMRSMAQARTQWLADPANQGRPPPSYLTDPTKWSIYSKDLGDAKGQFNGMNQGLTSYIDDLGSVAASPELKNVAGKPFTGALASAIPGSDAANLLTKMQGLGGTSKALAARGGPKGVGQNLAILGANSEDFTNLGIKDYVGDVIQPRIKNALTAQANAYGAAGRLADMPGYLQPYLDPMYHPGGDLDPGGSFKTVTPNKKLTQPTADDLASFKNDLERFGPTNAIKHFKAQGFDTSSVE
jgi:hypothetical protein